MKTKLTLSFAIMIAMMVSCGAQAAEYFSSHFCQPYTNGGAPTVQSYYQNQGSVLAVADTVLNCPLSGASLNGSLRVRLYYSSFNVSVAQPVSCRLWKISSANQTFVGASVNGVTNVESGAIDVLSNAGPVGTIGANLECHMKPGTKILGYYLY